MDHDTSWPSSTPPAAPWQPWPWASSQACRAPWLYLMGQESQQNVARDKVFSHQPCLQPRRAALPLEHSARNTHGNSTSSTTFCSVGAWVTFARTNTTNIERQQPTTCASTNPRHLLFGAGLGNVEGLGDAPRPVPIFHEIPNTIAEPQRQTTPSTHDANNSVVSNS